MCVCVHLTRASEYGLHMLEYMFLFTYAHCFTNEPPARLPKLFLLIANMPSPLHAYKKKIRLLSANEAQQPHLASLLVKEYMYT